jgi:hypothetical protein
MQATLMPYEDNPLPLIGDASPAHEEELINGILNHPDDLACEFIGKIPTEGSDDPYWFIARGLLSIDRSLDDEPMETMVNWDLTGTGWELCAVLVKADGHYDIYFPDDALAGEGMVTGVTVPADEKTYAPSHITFMGHHVPDGGSTLALLGCSLAGLAFIRKRKTASRN